MELEKIFFKENINGNENKFFFQSDDKGGIVISQNNNNKPIIQNLKNKLVFNDIQSLFEMSSDENIYKRLEDVFHEKNKPIIICKKSKLLLDKAARKKQNKEIKKQNKEIKKQKAARKKQNKEIKKQKEYKHRKRKTQKPYKHRKRKTLKKKKSKVPLSIFDAF